MTDCSKCKKPSEEINLTWVQVKGINMVYCDECVKQDKEEKTKT